MGEHMGKHQCQLRGKKRKGKAQARDFNWDLHVKEKARQGKQAHDWLV